MKKLKFIFIFVLFFFCFIGADASTYEGKLYEEYHPDSGFSVFAEESTGFMDYNSWIIKSTLENRVFYCIEPEIPLEGAILGSHDYIVGKSNIINSSRLTSDLYDKLELIAFYGYRYKDDTYDHTSKKWYGITQVMIWREVRPDLTWTFKNSRDSLIDYSLYLKEINEINKLVSEHKKVSSFAGKNIKLLIGETITLTDTNKVLDRFSLINLPKNATVTKNGNNFTITAKKQGLSSINFSKYSRTVDFFSLYTSSTYQDVIAMGKPTLPYFNITVEVTGGTLNLQKIDKDTGNNVSLGDASLKDAVYEIYDETKKKVGVITTNEKGQGKITLDYGKYTLKEVKSPTGYNLDEKEYTFELNENKTNVDLIVSDEIIKGKVLITKKKGSSFEKFTNERDAEFEIINSKGTVVEKLTTNENGKAITILPYGKYILHQIEGADGYIFSEDITFEILDNKIYEFNLENLSLSKLEVKKTDKDTGKALPGVMFSLYNENDNVIFEGVTNNKGIFETSNLKIGKYYLLEKKALDNYRINSEKIWFDVVKNGELIKIDIANEPMKGSLVLTKTDTNGNVLKDALFEIYDSNNKLAFSGKTEKDGKLVVSNLKLGKYFIYEKEAPKGYELKKEPVEFEISTDNEIVEITFTNSKKTNVPLTGINSSFSSFIIYSILSVTLIFITFIILKRKNNSS